MEMVVMDLRQEFPKHPLPAFPQRPQTDRRTPQPMVYVYEKEGWEYKVITRCGADEPLMSEDELNALGESGWELAGVVPLSGTAQFYFKRIRK